MLRIMWNMIFHKPHNTRPAAAIPVQPLTREDLLAAPNHSVYRLGHSTLLLKLQDKFWITDPVFAERASPVQWAGPKRFHQPPISLDQLPPIEAVILSHNLTTTSYYERCSAAANQSVSDPAGRRRHAHQGALTRTRCAVRLLASTEIAGVSRATPSQHFSAWPVRRNSTLWRLGDDRRRHDLLSGDSGYSTAQASATVRPVRRDDDETGAYKAWPDCICTGTDLAGAQD